MDLQKYDQVWQEGTDVLKLAMQKVQKSQTTNQSLHRALQFMSIVVALVDGAGAFLHKRPGELQLHHFESFLKVPRHKIMRSEILRLLPFWWLLCSAIALYEQTLEDMQALLLDAKQVNDKNFELMKAQAKLLEQTVEPRRDVASEGLWRLRVDWMQNHGVLDALLEAFYNQKPFDIQAPPGRSLQKEQKKRQRVLYAMDQEDDWLDYPEPPAKKQVGGPSSSDA